MYKQTTQQHATPITRSTVQQVTRRKAWATMNKAAQQAAANRITFQPFAY